MALNILAQQMIVYPVGRNDLWLKGQRKMESGDPTLLTLNMAVYAVKAANLLAMRLGNLGMLDDQTIRCLHDEFDKVREAAEAMGNADIESCVQMLGQLLPVLNSVLTF
jgi:hypothetical protein